VWRKNPVNGEVWNMAISANRSLLSIGAFLVILVVAIILVPLGLITWWMVLPLIIVLCGCWLVALGGMQSSNPQKYQRSAFSLFGWGFLLIAVGGAWFLYSFGWYYSLAVVLLVLGALAIVAAFRRK
jgi:hypothetical protein